jgi:hypothetical protein
MDTTRIMRAAKDLGVDLSLDGGNVLARPSGRLTPELRDAVRENKALLVKDLLMRDALLYLGERYVEGADLSGQDEWEDRINGAYPDGDQEEFRAAVRGYVKAGLRAFREADGRAA